MAEGKAQVMRVHVGTGQSERLTAFKERVENILLDEGLLTMRWSQHKETMVVRFQGEPAAAWSAFAAVMRQRLPVFTLRRTWDVLEGEVCGPYWELEFWSQAAGEGSDQRS
jgi:hypothetical protein